MPCRSEKGSAFMTINSIGSWKWLHFLWNGKRPTAHAANSIRQWARVILVCSLRVFNDQFVSKPFKQSRGERRFSAHDDPVNTANHKARNKKHCHSLFKIHFFSEICLLYFDVPQQKRDNINQWSTEWKKNECEFCSNTWTKNDTWTKWHVSPFDVVFFRGGVKPNN